MSLQLTREQQVFENIHLYLSEGMSIMGLSKKLNIPYSSASDSISKYLESNRPTITNDIIEFPEIESMLLDSNVEFWEGSNGLTVGDWDGMSKLEKQIYDD